MAKHFIKTLIIFTGIIVLGLLGMFLVSYFDQAREAPIEASGTE